MKECPNCKYASNIFQSITWTVMAKGPVEFSDDGDTILHVGPLQAELTIPAGQEPKSKSFRLICPQCDYTGPVKAFHNVRVSIIDGTTVTDNIMMFENIGMVAVHPDHVPAAKYMFTGDAMNPDTGIELYWPLAFTDFEAFTKQFDVATLTEYLEIDMSEFYLGEANED